MKKFFSFFILLFLGVICSACINTFAVHELNQLAADYIEKGDVQSAISRLESSVDLDNHVYESRYNLAVAYLKIDMCDKALNNIKIAVELSPNEPEAYYTLGVANNCSANSLFKKSEDELEEENIIEPDKIDEYVNFLTNANSAYGKYIELAPNADDVNNVKIQIENNDLEIQKYKAQQ